MTASRQPHKHAEVIKAWADGADIQVRDPSFSNPAWTDCGNGPIRWDIPGYEYRVKPQNVIRYAPVLQMPAKALAVGNGVTSAECAKMQASQYDSLVGVLRIELNPDTGNLISATLEK